MFSKEVLKRINIKTPNLLESIKRQKLKYFGHLKRHDTLEKHIVEAKLEGRRGRGRPTRRWEQNKEEWLGMTTTQANDRGRFQKMVWVATSRKETV